MMNMDEKELERISQLPQMGRFLIDAKEGCLRAFDGYPVMKKKTLLIMIGVYAIMAVVFGVIGFLTSDRLQILFFVLALMLAIYAIRYYQMWSALNKGVEEK